LLTGIALISGSWFIFKSIWITALVAVPVLAWMVFFLLIYPALMRKALATGISIQPNPEGGFPPPQV
jgi:membrane protein YdbS with pleckstrin-like domain